MLLTITVLTIALTFLVSRRWLYAELDIVSQFVLSLGCSVTLVVAGGAFAATQYRFSQKAFICMLGAYCLVAFAVLLWSMLKQKQLQPSRKIQATSLAMLVLVGICYVPPSQIVIGGQDPSAYVAVAKALAFDRKATVDSWAHRALTDVEREQLLGMSKAPDRSNQIYNGVSIKNDGHGKIELYLARGPSYLLGYAFLFQPMEQAFYANCLYCLLSIYIFFLFAKEVLNIRWACFATLLLALSPAELWFGRATYSEVPSQFFILFSLYHLVLLSKRSVEREHERSLLYLVSIVAAAGATLMRIDQAVLLFMLIFLAPWARAGGVSGTILSQALALLLLVLLRLELEITAFRYTFAVEKEIFFAKSPVTWGAGMVAASLVLYGKGIRAKLEVLYEWLKSYFFSERGIALISVAFILFLVWGLVMRDTLFPKEVFGADMNHNSGVRSMDETIFARMAVLCGPTVFVMSFWGILFYLKREKLQLATCVYVGLWAAYAWVLFFDQRNSPMLYWASRRYVPVLIPSTILFGCYFFTQLRVFRDEATNRLLAWSTAALSVIPMVVADRSILWRGEMNGLIPMVHQLESEFDRSSTVFLTDSRGRHYNFIFRFLGNFQVLQIPGLREYEELHQRMLPPLVSRLKNEGKTVVLLDDKNVNQAFDKMSSEPTKEITASYSRLGENLDQFPSTRWPRVHRWHYQRQ